MRNQSSPPTYCGAPEVTVLLLAKLDRYAPLQDPTEGRFVEHAASTDRDCTPQAAASCSPSTSERSSIQETSRASPRELATESAVRIRSRLSVEESSHRTE